MTLFVYINDVDVTRFVRLDALQSLETKAYQGETGTGTVIFDDPTGTLSFNGWWRFKVVETDCTSQPVIFSGYIGAREYARGPYESSISSNSRSITTTVTDLNVLVSQKVERGTDAKRPRETEAARITWLMSSTAFVNYIYDNGLVQTNAQVFDEADFTGRYAGEVLASLGSSSKLWYVYRDPTTEQPSLFYAYPSNSPRTSTLRISNVYSDYDGTTTFLPSDSKMTRDPYDTYSGVFLTYVGGQLYQSSSSTASNYIARDGLYDSNRIGRLSTAQGTAANYLITQSNEGDTIECTVLLPSTHVGLIEAGQRISVRFQHFPGYDSWNWQRITSCNVRPYPGNEKEYLLDLRFAPIRGAQLGGGPASPYPLQPGNDCTPSDTPIANAVAGYYNVSSGPAGLASVNDGDTTTGSTYGNGVAGAGTYYNGWKMDLGSAKTLSTMTMWSDSFGADSWFHTGSADSGTSSRPTHTTTGTWANTYTYHIGYSDDGTTFTTFLYDWTIATDIFSATLPSGLGSHRYWAFWWAWSLGGLAFYNAPPMLSEWSVYECVSDAVAPQTGQPVMGEVPTPSPDGTTTTFTTLWPFADGTLEVYVDQLDQTSAVTSYDGAAGTFTLGFAPKTGESIVVNYRGR